MLLISKKIDSNWYEGFHDERKGIFPIAYVQLIQEGIQILLPFMCLLLLILTDNQ